MKSSVEDTIKKYLPSLKARTKKIQIKALPAIYHSYYDFEELILLKKSFLLIKVKEKALGPKDFKKHSKKIADLIDYPQVWHLKELHAHKVRRMIENEIDFIVEDKHIYLPSLRLSIKSQPEKINLDKRLSGLSINILIREIIKEDLSGKNKAEIATIFKTTKMSAGRAIEPLLANNLCEQNKVGVAKKINFKKRLELWNFFKKHISSPISNIVYLNKLPKNMPFSGVSSLSKQSMLADNPIPSFAIYKKTFNKKYSKEKLVLEDDAQAQVELWDRPPILVEQNLINVLDCYLILKDEPEERLQIELEHLLKKHNLTLGT